MGQGGLNGFHIAAAHVGDGEEFDKIGTIVHRIAGFAGGEYTGHRHQAQLHGFFDDSRLHVGGNDEGAAGLLGQMHLLGGEHRACTNMHTARKMLCQFLNVSSGLLVGHATIGTVGHLQQTDTALIQCLCYLQQLFRRNPPQNGD